MTAPQPINPGDKVWVRVKGHPWWPALVINDPPEALKNIKNHAPLPVFYYGSHN